MFGWLRALEDRAFGKPRSPKWREVRAAHLKKQPVCQACGRAGSLEVHHIVPFHVDNSKELEPENLLSLCADPCHIVHGHLMSWRRWDPDCVANCKNYRERVEKSKREPGR